MLCVIMTCEVGVVKDITIDLLKKKYFIFDIDGTLIDSMGMWSLVDQKLVYEYTGRLVEEMELKAFRDGVLYHIGNVHGNIYMIYYEELIRHYGLDLTAEEYNDRRQEMSQKISENELDYKPGAGEFLRLLKGLGKKIGVVTTTTTQQYDIYENRNEKICKQAPLKAVVDKKVLCEDVQRKKPDPEAYLKIVHLFGCKPEECLVFEDSFNGIVAAKTAGLDVVAVRDNSASNERELIDKVADYKVDSFDEMIKALCLEEECEK